MKRLLSFLRRGIIYWLPMALLMTAALARLAIPEVLDRLSLFAFDIYERAAPRQMPDDLPVLIVDIAVAVAADHRGRHPRQAA